MQTKQLIIAILAILLLSNGCSNHPPNTKKTTPPQKSSATNAPPQQPHNSKVVYLTFDADMTPAMFKKLRDGKVTSWYSPGLIKYLEDNDIAATFFVTGMFAETYPEEVKQWAGNKNFVIENHSYDHPGFEQPCYGLVVVHTDQEKLEELQKTQEILTKLTGKAPQYFRYPGLCHNQHDDELVAQLHLQINDGNLASGDAFNTNTNAIVANVLTHVKPGDTIVFHSGGPNAPATEEAIPKIVQRLKEQGYGFDHL